MQATANGQCDKGVSKEDSVKVFSADFHNFVNGNLIVSYMYECWMHYSLLEFAAGVMPRTAAASSSEPASATARPSCRATARRGGRGRGKRTAEVKDLAKVLGQPLRIERTQEEREQQRLDAASAKLQLRRQVPSGPSFVTHRHPSPHPPTTIPTTTTIPLAPGALGGG